LVDGSDWLALYGTTPPRADASEERIELAATRLAERVRALPLDGLIVYDVQDEQARTARPRPFPFLPTIEARRYSRRLCQLTGLTPITYKCVATTPAAAWPAWLTATHQEYGLDLLSLVGRPASTGVAPSLSLSQALRQAATHAGNFGLGGVVIAERHRPGRSESRRLLDKAALGCQFFVSQAVYHAETTIQLLYDYARDCRRQEVAPRRIVLTFVPCGRPKTVEFIRWLGVNIGEATASVLLDDPAPLSRSIRICCSHLRLILDHSTPLGLPLGLNVESVSIYRDEIDASIDLFHSLQAVVAEYR
jgi:hypothetical protein